MKTRLIKRQDLFNVAYDYGYVDCASWIVSHSDILFKSELSTMTFCVDVICDDFRVLFRPYRHRQWHVLSVSKNARYVLQDLFDFLFC